MMTQRSAANETLEARGELLRRLRLFFYDRGFVEVETPLLAAEVIPELHIEPPRIGGQFLQASPELHMKRLVAAGMRKIFQVTRSFRDDELGRLHCPEFTIVEWYRTGDDLQSGMQLLDELCQTVAAAPPARQTTYAAAFAEHVGLCPHTSTVDQLAGRAAALNVPSAKTFDGDERDEYLNLLLSFVVEPQLGRDAPELLYEYPASQSALAKTLLRDDGVEVAGRFELYWHGVELANGYDELTDATELRRRLQSVNAQRARDGRPQLPLPESLLDAMQRGLPNCAGCALGFDRLVMLALGKESIAEVRPAAGQ